MRKCPKCGGEKFKALIKRAALIQIEDDLTVTILKEGVNNFELIEEEIICANKECDFVGSFEEITAKIPCSSCGELHTEEELVDGKCDLCTLKAQLGSVTKEDLFKLILDLQHKAGPLELKNDKKIEKAEETEKEVEKKNAPKEEEDKPEEEKKPKRKSRKKTVKAEEPEKNPEEDAEEDTEEDTEEEAQEETETPEVTEEKPEEKIEEIVKETEEKEKPMTPERAEANDVSTKPQAEAVNDLDDIFGSTEEPVLTEETEKTSEEEADAPPDFVF